MEIATHVAHIEQEARSFVTAAARGGLDAAVPSCPGWDVRELVRHLSEIHLWAAAQVAGRATQLWPDGLDELATWWPELAVFWPDDDDLLDFYLATSDNLVRQLKDPPPDVDARTFLPAPTPLAMWARRQCHELTIHRVDAEQAAGVGSVIDPAVASDGIDELLMAFAPRATETPLAAARCMVVDATDTGDRWSVTMGPEGIDTTRSDGRGDVRVSGSAVDLYRSLWNRGDADVGVDGDPDVLAAWHANHHVRWS